LPVAAKNARNFSKIASILGVSPVINGKITINEKRKKTRHVMNSEITRRTL